MTFQSHLRLQKESGDITEYSIAIYWNPFIIKSALLVLAIKKVLLRINLGTILTLFYYIFSVYDVLGVNRVNTVFQEEEGSILKAIFQSSI